MRRLPLLALLVALAALMLPAAGIAERPTKGAIRTPVDTVHPDDIVMKGTLPIVGIDAPAFRAQSLKVAAAAAPTLGEKRNWLALDDLNGFYYRKEYSLLALQPNVEVWVATELNRRAPASTAFPQVGQSSGLNFLDGDCRNGVRTEVTPEQANYLATQFSTNILPKESVAFSIAPARDGSAAQLGAPTFSPQGPGENTVVLVDNVRDDNFYDFNNTQGLSYIAGFFSSQLNAFFDRNVMTIDGFDWLHRTGADPPNEPTTDLCTSAPARPFRYEGVFAHEYQHLLEQYEDSDEFNWINEGLADWAQTLTGYVNPALPITNNRFDSHVQCFLGWLGVQTDANPIPRPTSGPENSLTWWNDQGDGEILCDYGAAYTMMEMLAGRYGQSFMTALHRGDANGLAGLQEALATVSGKKARKTTPQDILHDWSLMVALDSWIDHGARTNGRPNERDVTTPTLDASINWDTPETYSTPGAPPNGADYVRLRDAAGNYLGGEDIRSLGFAGATTLPTLPVRWTVDANPPEHTGDPALYSGAANLRDEAIVRQVTVPTGAAATLTFDAFWNEELGWDFGFVQVSTDAGVTYESLACTDTTTETNPDALPTAKDNVPGFTGYSAGWKPQTCSLAAYAGQTVLLAFRAFNDPAALGENPAVPPGFWVDDVTVGTAPPISDGSSLSGWRSFTEVRPNPVAGFTVYLVSLREKNKDRITVRQLKLTGDFNLQGKAKVRKYIDRRADFVAAIVFYDDPAETSRQYAPYRLSVNGVTQPGGGF